MTSLTFSGVNGCLHLSAIPFEEGRSILYWSGPASD
nr:unnamed protein product [Callosobruchus chinensis]